jgi:hypothetical protein
MTACRSAIFKDPALRLLHYPKKDPGYVVSIEGASIITTSEPSPIFLPSTIDETSIIRVDSLSSLTSTFLKSGKIYIKNQTSKLSKIGEPVRISLSPDAGGLSKNGSSVLLVKAN